MNKIKSTGTVLAIAAAAAFSLAPTVASAKHHCTHSSMIKCMGVNACKGNSSCKTARNACKGHNGCKGQGYVSMTKKQCEQIIGKN